ncbi:MAG: SRPBCC domain-containing protein [Hyphomicrobiaceae bacterium]|nr:SRPBCC domain-containing protein [Hyphomicrobiaceae bacterium]MCC0023659.1 SRPBCC domain-containing protein [Hyphomicrobiaceae bacterium]
MTTEAHPMQVDVSSPRDFVLTRTFDAPKDLVWKCWTDADHLAAWWGPEIFTNRVDMDFRPGGRQLITMIDPEGKEYPIEATFFEIEEGSHFIGGMTTEDYDGDWKAQFAKWAGGNSDGVLKVVMRVDFEDLGDSRTRVTMTQTFPTTGERDANVKMGAEPGWRESFVKLDAYLTRLQ